MDPIIHRSLTKTASAFFPHSGHRRRRSGEQSSPGTPAALANISEFQHVLCSSRRHQPRHLETVRGQARRCEIRETVHTSCRTWRSSSPANRQRERQTAGRRPAPAAGSSASAARAPATQRCQQGTRLNLSAGSAATQSAGRPAPEGGHALAPRRTRLASEAASITIKHGPET